MSNLFSLVAQQLLAGTFEIRCEHEWTVNGIPLTPDTWYECTKCGKKRERG
jgi:hypothetical protein